MSGHGPVIPMTSRRAGALRGVAEVPGDKSISHRSLILGALAVGETKISGLLEGQDVLDTGKAMRAFGADVIEHGGGEWSVFGVGVGGFAEPEDVINCGNAGTGVRLIMGAMATSPITATFTGDASLRSRPMGRITDPLALFGAKSYGRRGGRSPCRYPARPALPADRISSSRPPPARQGSKTGARSTCRRESPPHRAKDPRVERSLELQGHGRTYQVLQETCPT